MTFKQFMQAWGEAVRATIANAPDLDIDHPAFSESVADKAAQRFDWEGWTIFFKQMERSTKLPADPADFGGYFLKSPNEG